MTDIKIILDELAADNSRLAKEKILKREINNTLLKEVFLAALNPMVNYYQSSIDYFFATINNAKFLSLSVALTQLHNLTNASHEKREFLANIAAQLNSSDRTVLEYIIGRDLKCGVQTSTVNKIWPGLIPTFDVMLAHKDISNIKYPCYGQVKFDGARVHLYWDGIKASAWSRSGKEIKTLGVFDSIMLNLFGNETATLDGELLVVKDGKILDRKTGNGIINKASKGTITQPEADCLRMVAWDIVDFSGIKRYDERLNDLSDKFSQLPKNMTQILMAETSVINTPEEAQKMFEDCIALGHEGAMMKNMDQKWEPKRVKGIGKMKAENVADLIVVDVKEGTGKYQGLIGSLICQTSDGLLEVSVGSGFSDDERKLPFETYIGKIVEVMYNQKITSKGKEKTSLFLPRFLTVRTDKLVANTLDELV